MSTSDQTAADERETAGLLAWTGAQLGWLRDSHYEEADAIIVRGRFSLWYVKPAVAVVGISVDRSRGEMDIRLGPDEGAEPVYAHVVLLDALKACRDHELAGPREHFGPA